MDRVASRAASLFMAFGLVVFLAWQAPHFVHHLFEPDELSADCLFATAGDRLAGTEPEILDVAPAPASDTILDSRTPWSSQRALRASAARAPPHVIA